MVADCVHLAERIGSFFLNCTSAMIVVFGTGMWINYIKRNNPSKILDSSIHRSWTRWIVAALLIAFLYGWFMVLLSVGSIKVALISFMLAILMIYGYIKYRWNNIIVERYNYRFVIKHTFYSLVVVVAFTIIMYYSCSEHFLYDIFRGNYSIYFQQWNRRVDILFAPQMARSIFAVVVSLYGMFLPIMVGFWISHHQARKVKSDIRKAFVETKENADKLQTEYWDLIAKIVAKKEVKVKSTATVTKQSKKQIGRK